MSVLFEIDRDFPFQVSLSFDEAAMEVLEWLDDYVDLSENCIRYCFPHDWRRHGFQAAVRECVGKASCRWPPLITDSVAR